MFLFYSQHVRYQEMVAKGEISQDVLPSTERADYYHTVRVHLQIMVWETPDNSVLDPSEWSWSLSRGTLEPVFTNYNVAPDALLNFVRSQCKTECTSKKCSCRKHCLKCVTACGNCRDDCTKS